MRHLKSKHSLYLHTINVISYKNILMYKIIESTYSKWLRFIVA